jgi:hypothetical protein
MIIGFLESFGDYICPNSERHPVYMREEIADNFKKFSRRWHSVRGRLHATGMLLIGLYLVSFAEHSVSILIV